MVILMFADKSQVALQKKIEKSFIDKEVKNEELVLPPTLISTDVMNYFFIETNL